MVQRTSPLPARCKELCKYDLSRIQRPPSKNTVGLDTRATDPLLHQILSYMLPSHCNTVPSAKLHPTRRTS